MQPGLDSPHRSSCKGFVARRWQSCICASPRCAQQADSCYLHSTNLPCRKATGYSTGHRQPDRQAGAEALCKQEGARSQRSQPLNCTVVSRHLRRCKKGSASMVPAPPWRLPYSGHWRQPRSYQSISSAHGTCSCIVGSNTRQLVALRSSPAVSLPAGILSKNEWVQALRGLTQAGCSKHRCWRRTCLHLCQCMQPAAAATVGSIQGGRSNRGSTGGAEWQAGTKHTQAAAPEQAPSRARHGQHQAALANEQHSNREGRSEGIKSNSAKDIKLETGQVALSA